MFVYNLKKKTPSILQLKQSTKKKLTINIEQIPIDPIFSCWPHFTAGIFMGASWPCGGLQLSFLLVQWGTCRAWHAVIVENAQPALRFPRGFCRTNGSVSSWFRLWSAGGACLGAGFVQLACAHLRPWPGGFSGVRWAAFQKCSSFIL